MSLDYTVNPDGDHRSWMSVRATFRIQEPWFQTINMYPPGLLEEDITRRSQKYDESAIQEFVNLIDSDYGLTELTKRWPNRRHYSEAWMAPYVLLQLILITGIVDSVRVGRSERFRSQLGIAVAEQMDREGKLEFDLPLIIGAYGAEEAGYNINAKLSEQRKMFEDGDPSIRDLFNGECPEARLSRWMAQENISSMISGTDLFLSSIVLRNETEEQIIPWIVGDSLPYWLNNQIRAILF